MNEAAVRCFVGVGSNIDPEQNIPRALETLAGLPRLRLTAISTFYRTRPVGKTEGADFYNGVVELWTPLSPGDLRSMLDRVEERCGRSRHADRSGPRTIDLDLLLFGNAVLDGTAVRVPHPDVERRRFVHQPLFELAPDLVLPGSSRRLIELVQGSEPPGERLSAFTRALRQRVLGG